MCGSGGQVDYQETYIVNIMSVSGLAGMFGSRAFAAKLHFKMLFVAVRVPLFTLSAF